MALMVAEDDFRVQPDIECEDAGHWQPRTKQLQALLYLVVDNDISKADKKSSVDKFHQK